jgi:hypothetical protein
LGAEPHYFFLDEKVTKNQVSKEASLRTRPLPCKTDKTTGCIILPQPLQPTLMAKRRYALSAARPNLFYQFSPEAFLLTLFSYTNTSNNNDGGFWGLEKSYLVDKAVRRAASGERR